MASKRADPFYLSKEWEQLRAKRIKLDQWHCQHCGTFCRGKRFNEPRPQVDHIIPRLEAPELALALSNTQLLCQPCHNRKTEADRTDKPTIGADGYPVCST